MKKIPVQESAGTILCHDITRIIPGKEKGRAFKKGYIITDKDIPVLLSLGKDYIYVWEQKEGYLHENDAAQRLAGLAAGNGLEFSEVKEGKINLVAAYSGLLKINRELLYQINSMGEIVLVTLHNNYPIKKGQIAAGTRAIPLLIEESKIKEAEERAGGEKIVDIKPYMNIKVGIVTTGNEVYYGRIQDAFGPVIISKIEEYGCTVIGQTILPDDSERITAAIENYIFKGVGMVLCTGGMSVDPDDVTPLAIKNTGAEIISYGAPVLPGSMLMIAYKDGIPVLGLPGCVMYSKRTVFDLVLPRLLSNDKIKTSDMAAYGHGGLCMDCEVCRFPDCAFGKGV